MLNIGDLLNERKDVFVLEEKDLTHTLIFAPTGLGMSGLLYEIQEQQLAAQHAAELMRENRKINPKPEPYWLKFNNRKYWG